MTHEKNDLLEELRKDIDEIDREICDLIAERAGVSAEIGRVKRISGYPVENLQRETELIKTARAAHPEAAATVENQDQERKRTIPRREQWWWGNRWAGLPSKYQRYLSMLKC